MSLATVAMVGFLVLVGGFISMTGVSALRGYSRMSSADSTTVAAVDPAQGEVELSGTARPARGTEVAPITRGDTLVAKWKAREPHAQGSEASDWGHVVRPFVLDDGTGEILVDPRGANWNFEREEWTVEGGAEPPRGIGEFLREDWSESPFLSERVSDGTRKFEEGRLDPGEEVYVYGPVRSGPHVDAPDSAVRPYVGADESGGRDDVHPQVDMNVGRDTLPGAGDAGGTLAVGDAEGSAVFTIADRGEDAAQREQLKDGLVKLGLGVTIMVAPVAAYVFVL